MSDFFAESGKIRHVLALVDIRHGATEDDMNLLRLLNYYILPFTVVLTKADKLSKMKLKEHIKAIAADLYLGEKNLLATSAETGYGKDVVLQKIRDVIDMANVASSSEMEGENEDEE